MHAGRWLAVLTLLLPAASSAQPPVVADDRLVVELVAKEPDIVTPTGLAVDEQGRVWVIENQTHQRTPEYKGPPTDRIRVFDDFDARGKARRVRTFAEGFRNSMGLALDHGGRVFLATRSDIYVLRDTDGDGVADERQVIVKLDTPGDYPHNGLSGFAFDALGNLYFGLGENLGAPYKLVGADGTTFAGGGEGGSIYRCRPDGTHLARVATGFWNPFALAFDAFGRLFAVDNDPDSRGPCRLLHIVEGGDYGYRFRNGRKGLHPFTSWNGELPGTLPMVAGTAEAPSGIVAYESTGLPPEYGGQLLTTSWGDHVLERFELVPRGASFTSQAKTLVKGGEDFRPVAIAVAPDGSLVVSDWVDKSYPVHGKGRIWRVRMKAPFPDDKLTVSRVGQLALEKLPALLRHPKREVRQAAGEALAAKGAHKALADALREEPDVRARLQALWAAALLERDTANQFFLEGLKDAAPEVRAEAARLLGPELAAHLLEAATKDPGPQVRMQAIIRLRQRVSLKAILPLLADKDPFLAGAALTTLGRPGSTALLLSARDTASPELRVGILLALRRGGTPLGRAALPAFLEDPDPEVRRAAIQWVGEEKLHDYAKLLQAAASRPPVTKGLFEALWAANDFLYGPKREPGDEPSGEAFVAQVLKDSSQPTAFRALALRMLPPDHPALNVGTLRQFLEDQALRPAAVRALALRADAKSQELLRRLAADRGADPALRADAVLGLAHSAQPSPETRRLLLSLLEQPALRRDALRSLRDAPDVAPAIRAQWENWSGDKALSPDERRELAGQVLLALRPEKGGDQEKRLREAAGPVPRGEAVLAGAGDPAAGERVFFHARGPRCFACHRVEGRGGLVGPDLSLIARSTSRAKLIESILAPSKEIAPRYVAWVITTKDGKSRTGVIVEEGADSTLKIGDALGKIEVIPRLDVEGRQASPVSLMPDNLPEQMTRQEFLDLLAYLESLK